MVSGEQERNPGDRQFEGLNYFTGNIVNLHIIFW